MLEALVIESIIKIASNNNKITCIGTKNDNNDDFSDDKRVDRKISSVESRLVVCGRSCAQV